MIYLETVLHQGADLWLKCQEVQALSTSKTEFDEMYFFDSIWFGEFNQRLKTCVVCEGTFYPLMLIN